MALLPFEFSLFLSSSHVCACIYMYVCMHEYLSKQIMFSVLNVHILKGDIFVLDNLINLGPGSLLETANSPFQESLIASFPLSMVGSYPPYFSILFCLPTGVVIVQILFGRFNFEDMSIASCHI